MSSMATQSQLRRQTETRIIKIDQVDMNNMLVTGLDNYSTRLHVSMLSQGGVATIPALGEVWQVQRQNNEWLLNGRFDSGAETSSLSSLAPGDQRLEASGTLYLNGQDVALNANGNVSIKGTEIDFTGNVTVNGHGIAPGYLMIW